MLKIYCSIVSVASFTSQIVAWNFIIARREDQPRRPTTLTACINRDHEQLQFLIADYGFYATANN